MAELGVSATDRAAMEDRLDVARLELHERTIRLHEIRVMRCLLQLHGKHAGDELLAGDESARPVLEKIVQRLRVLEALDAAENERYKKADAELAAAKMALEDLTMSARDESYELGSVEYTRREQKKMRMVP